MSDTWFCSNEEGVVLGPLSLADIKTILSHVSNAKDLLVWGDGSEHWKRAKNVPELAAFVIKPPPLPFIPPRLRSLSPALLLVIKPPPLPPIPPPLPPLPPPLPHEPLIVPAAVKDHEDRPSHQDDQAEAIGPKEFDLVESQSHKKRRRELTLAHCLKGVFVLATIATTYCLNGVLVFAIIATAWLNTQNPKWRSDLLADFYSAYARGDFATALELIRPLADKGVTPAQFNLGVLYEEGQGVTQDYSEGVKWFRLAAEKGYGPAQYNLGLLYGLGRGVTQDFGEAAKWYRLAAEQGLTEAQFNLAILYERGRGITQDFEEAVKWYRLAAEKGYAPAQYNLGVLYASGQGIAQDWVRAYMWISFAAKQNSEVRERATINRDLIDKYLTSAQAFQARELAQQCELRSFNNCD